MKKTSIIIGIVGLASVCAFNGVIAAEDLPHRLLSLPAGLLGILLVVIAVGLWRRRLFAWRLGFVAISFASVLPVAEVCLQLPAVSTNEKIIIVSSSVIGGILCVAFWSVVWYYRRNWFLIEGQRAEPTAPGDSSQARRS